MPNQPRTVSTTKTDATAATANTATPPTHRATRPLAASPSRLRRLASTRMKMRVMGVITPSRTWVLTMRWIRLPGTSTSDAPMTIWAVNSPRNSGACRKLLDTDRSAPTASATAYDVDSGTTAAARAEAPSNPRPNSHSAADPATGSRAWAAWAAELSGPVPPSTAAVATMMELDTNDASNAPPMASTRSNLNSSGPIPLSTTAPASYSWMYGVTVVPIRATPSSRKALEMMKWGHSAWLTTFDQSGWPRTAATG